MEIVCGTHTCSTCGFWDWREHFCYSEGDYTDPDGCCGFWQAIPETKEAPEPDPWADDNACSSGKKAFTNRIAALFALCKLERVSNRERIPRRAYKCPECRCFHLTSKPLNGEKH
jgi:hypothetical protein